MMASSAPASDETVLVHEILPDLVGDHVLTVAGGRRDRKKQATRRSLRNAALELVAMHGFAHVTVEDIAEAADVATRTFFNYFPSKESAVIGADPERIEELRADLLARPADEPPLEVLGSVLVRYAATIDEDFDEFGEGKRAWFQRFSAVRADPDLAYAYAAHMAEVEESLAIAIAERLGTDPRHDPYPALVTATALAAARVAAIYWSADGGEDSLARLTRVAISSLASGLVHDEATLGSAPPKSGPRRRRHRIEIPSTGTTETSERR
ncbi:MAG: TetR family transcriptional regulator [Acidimicrobiales bacterium]|jgi:AcrR family transcriptional regulator